VIAINGLKEFNMRVYVQAIVGLCAVLAAWVWCLVYGGL